MKALMEQTLREDQQELVFRSDSTALLLVDYFTQHGTANDQMRAYYLLGRSYDCKHNPVLALRFFLVFVKCGGIQNKITLFRKFRKMSGCNMS